MRACGAETQTSISKRPRGGGKMNQRKQIFVQEKGQRGQPGAGGQGCQGPGIGATVPRRTTNIIQRTGGWHPVRYADGVQPPFTRSHRFRTPWRGQLSGTTELIRTPCPYIRLFTLMLARRHAVVLVACLPAFTWGRGAEAVDIDGGLQLALLRRSNAGACQHDLLNSRIVFDEPLQRQNLGETGIVGQIKGLKKRVRERERESQKQCMNSAKCTMRLDQWRGRQQRG